MTTTDINLEILYVPKVLEILEDDGLRKAVAKGRRVGFTHSTSYWLIEQMLEKTVKVLWVDTVQGNLKRYIERYWMPLLKQLPQEMWNWEKSANLVTVTDSLCDFRSAERPETIEGFGYDIVFLNEAGIILRNPYLWDNAISPMLLDNPDAVCIAAGVPKGKNKFFDLHSSQNWKSYSITTYDNDFLDEDTINQLVDDLPESVVDQEIYGKFLDTGDSTLFNYGQLQSAIDTPTVDVDGAEVWALDVARHGSDNSVLAKRRYRCVLPLEVKSINDTMQLSSWLSHEFTAADKKPQQIFIDVIGMGWGVFDRCRELGLPVVAADVAITSHMSKTANKRAEMYRRFESHLRTGMSLPKDRVMMHELANTTYEYDNKGNFKITSKDDLKKVIGHSPDRADAIALTFFEDVQAITDYNGTSSGWDDLPALGSV